MLEGMAKVFEILANKISRKAVLISMGIILIYLLATAANVNYHIFSVCLITALVVFFTILQYYVDKKKREEKKE